MSSKLKIMINVTLQVLTFQNKNTTPPAKIVHPELMWPAVPTPPWMCFKMAWHALDTEFSQNCITWRNNGKSDGGSTQQCIGQLEAWETPQQVAMTMCVTRLTISNLWIRYLTLLPWFYVSIGIATSDTAVLWKLGVQCMSWPFKAHPHRFGLAGHRNSWCTSLS